MLAGAQGEGREAAHKRQHPDYQADGRLRWLESESGKRYALVCPPALALCRQRTTPLRLRAVKRCASLARGRAGAREGSHCRRSQSEHGHALWYHAGSGAHMLHSQHPHLEAHGPRRRWWPRWGYPTVLCGLPLSQHQYQRPLMLG